MKKNLRTDENGADMILSVIVALAFGALVALFVPAMITVIISAGALVGIVLPAFNRYRTPLAMMLLTMIVVLLIRILVWKQALNLGFGT